MNNHSEYVERAGTAQKPKSSAHAFSLLSLCFEALCLLKLQYDHEGHLGEILHGLVLDQMALLVLYYAEVSKVDGKLDELPF